MVLTSNFYYDKLKQCRISGNDISFLLQIVDKNLSSHSINFMIVAIGLKLLNLF